MGKVPPGSTDRCGLPVQDRAIEQKFQQTDARLTALESSIQEIKAAQQESVANQRAFQDATQAAFKSTEHGLKTYVATSIDQVRQELDKSVKTALAEQTSAINSNLLDLKQMFMKQTKRTRTKGEDDMDSS